MQIKIIHAGKYTLPEKHRQCSTTYSLGMIVSGFDCLRTYSPGGLLLPQISHPSIALSPPGSTTDFSANHLRENYVITFDTPDFIWNEDELCFECRHHSGTIRICRNQHISERQMVILRNKFERIIDLKKSSLPRNILTVELLINDLIAEYMILQSSAPRQTGSAVSTAESLRMQIDADTEFKFNLTEHCRKLGMTLNYCRKLFSREFGISPGEYRLRLRLEKLFELLSSGKSSHKEIADQLGISHVQHLHTFVRQRCDMTLNELEKKLPR